MKIKYIGMGLLVLAALEITASLGLTYVREYLWNAIAARELMPFVAQIGVFTGLALALCFITGYSGYLINVATIKWREVLDAKEFRLGGKVIDNIDQRRQDDCRNYPELALTLGYGLLKAAAYVAVFSVSLCNNFKASYLLILVIYGIIGTYISKKIATPLIVLNYKTQQAEASYRKDLSNKNFLTCIGLMWSMAIKEKYLSYFQSFFGQIGVIVPLLLVAPEYFSGTMTVGLLMRFSSVSGTILDNLSYGINNFGTFNRLLSCRSRLKEIGIL